MGRGAGERRGVVIGEVIMGMGEGSWTWWCDVVGVVAVQRRVGGVDVMMWEVDLWWQG